MLSLKTEKRGKRGKSNSQIQFKIAVLLLSKNNGIVSTKKLTPLRKTKTQKNKTVYGHNIPDSRTSTMSFFENHYYKLNRELLLLIGLWPYQDPKTSRFRTSIVNIFLIVAIIPQVLNMITSKFNMDLLMNNFMFFLPYLCIITVYFTAYINKKEIRLLSDRIKCDWNKLKPDELRIVEKYADQNSFYIPVLVIFIFSAIPIILKDIMPGNNNYTYELIYPIELLIIEKEKNPYVILIISNVFIIFTGIVSLANYTYFIAFIQHTCAIFRVVGYILEHVINEKEQQNLFQLIDNKEIYYKIIRAINYHKLAIEYTEIINSFAEICYLIQIVMTLLILAADIMRLMQASSNLKSLTMTAICTLHMSGMIIWTLFNCIIGQRVLNHSHIVFKKTKYSITRRCTIPWYLFSPRLQKLATLMLMRSMRPSYLSIGKICYSRPYLTIAMLLCIVIPITVIWNRIEYDWNELITTRGINILREYASTSRLYNIILIGLYYVTVIFLIFQTILPTFLDVVLPLNESRPLKSPILIDSLIKQTIYFYPTLVSTYVLLVFFGIVTTAVNGFFVVCVQHACAMFRLVRYTLDEAFENVNQKLYVNEENELICQKIIRTIKVHKSAIELLLRVESIEENLEDTLMCIFHLFGSFCWGLMGNMLCQSIIDHSSATFDQAFCKQ
ncbi:odorant receptor 22c-like isoform X1 [Vespula squamosa]|uniref:Odorant receptor 22c-like isoform X1 n=1 Tax=Vespula squamosa TaxID=30214 RepID=A0ABD2C7C4_VESSQ